MRGSGAWKNRASAINYSCVAQRKRIVFERRAYKLIGEKDSEINFYNLKKLGRRFIPIKLQK